MHLFNMILVLFVLLLIVQCLGMNAHGNTALGSRLKIVNTTHESMTARLWLKPSAVTALK